MPLLNFFKTRKKTSIAILIVAVLIGYNVLKPAKKEVLELYTVTKGNIIQEVSVTGTVKSAKSVDLAFEKSGKLAAKFADIGVIVKKGDLLASLFTDDLEAQLRQAQAGTEIAVAQLRQFEAALQGQQIKLKELERGARGEEITLAETKVLNSQKSVADAEENFAKVKNKTETDLGNAYKDVADTLSDAYAKSEDAVKVKSAGLIGGEKYNGFYINYSVCDSSEGASVASLRGVIEADLDAWKTGLAKISETSTPEDLDSAIKTAAKYLVRIKDFIDRANALLSGACVVGDTTKNTDRTNLNTARTNVNAVAMAVNAQAQTISAQKALNETSLLTAQTALTSAKNALASAQDELIIKKSGSSQEQIDYQKALVSQAEANRDAQKAQIRSARANEDNIRAQIEKALIYAPIAGTVSRFTKEEGEMVSLNEAVISLLSASEFEMETNVTESDIAKIKIGDEAKVTLDAFGSELVWAAAVTKIDPAETVVEGVSTYKTTLQFTDAEKKDQEIKSGMTANIDINTAQAEGVLLVPQRAVFSKNGEKFVQILDSENAAKQTFADKAVKTGLKGSDGNIEITEGLSEGDKITQAR